LQNELNAALRDLYNKAQTFENVCCELLNIYNQTHLWRIDQQKIRIQFETLSRWQYKLQNIPPKLPLLPATNQMLNMETGLSTWGIYKQRAQGECYPLIK
jgi:hypothetical protein